MVFNQLQRRGFERDIGSPMSKTRKAVLIVFAILAIGFIAPERIRIPVVGASKADWNKKSFWFEPWGTSGVHKGIDIFGRLGSAVASTTDGFVVYTGDIAKGGKVIIVLGPKWRLPEVSPEVV